MTSGCSRIRATFSTMLLLAATRRALFPSCVMYTSPNAWKTEGLATCTEWSYEEKCKIMQVPLAVGKKAMLNFKYGICISEVVRQCVPHKTLDAWCWVFCAQGLWRLSAPCPGRLQGCQGNSAAAESQQRSRLLHCKLLSSVQYFHSVFKQGERKGQFSVVLCCSSMHTLPWLARARKAREHTMSVTKFRI